MSDSKVQIAESLINWTKIVKIFRSHMEHYWKG